MLMEITEGLKCNTLKENIKLHTQTAGSNCCKIMYVYYTLQNTYIITMVMCLQCTFRYTSRDVAMWGDYNGR